MKKLSLLLLMLGFITSCDNGGGPSSGENPVSPITTNGASVCLDYKNGQIPAGTYAKRVATGEKAVLDSKGCFSFPAVEVAARVSGSDSIQFYNDSALFALSIPYINHGEVIQVVPTVISYKGCPNSVIDSVFLVAYDTEHMLSRRVKMKKATYRDTSEYSRTVWSLEGGNNFKVHFDVFDKKDRWASQLIESEPGSTMSLTYRVSDKAESFVPYVPDTLIFTQTNKSNLWDLLWYSRNGGGKYATGEFDQYTSKDSGLAWAVKAPKIHILYKGSSIYGGNADTAEGIAVPSGITTTVDGSTVRYIREDTSLYARTDTAPYSHTVHVQVRDAAGYGVDKQMTILYVRQFVEGIDTLCLPSTPYAVTFQKADTLSTCIFQYSRDGVASTPAYKSRACVAGDSVGYSGDSILVRRDYEYKPSTLVISPKNGVCSRF